MTSSWKDMLGTCLIVLLRGELKELKIGLSRLLSVTSLIPTSYSSIIQRGQDFEKDLSKGPGFRALSLVQGIPWSVSRAY